MTVSVIIPTYQGERYLPALLDALHQQTRSPEQIVVIDSSSRDNTVGIARRHGCAVKVIPQSEFNHGGTRNDGARLANGDALLFMTQDALPANANFVAELLKPIEEDRAAASYARQLPRPDANPIETFARGFNYPERSEHRTSADIERLGVKAYFFSDAASLTRKDLFWKLGGYPEDVIVNEDMLLCSKLIHAGHAIAYAAAAQVEHSHNYGLRQQLRRYFDIGVFTIRSSAIMQGARASGEGLRFTRELMQELRKRRAWGWMPYAVADVGARYIGYTLGKNEALLPTYLKKRLTMQPAFWLKSQ